MKKTTFKENQNQLGIKQKGPMDIIGNQPPKKSITIELHIRIILQYSAKKKRVKVMDEYSTLKPLTNSDSASGRSKGNLLVSASILIKNRITEGQSGAKKKISSCIRTILLRLAEPVNKSTGMIIGPMDTS